MIVCRWAVKCLDHPPSADVRVLLGQCSDAVIDVVHRLARASKPTEKLRIL